MRLRPRAGSVVLGFLVLGGCAPAPPAASIAEVAVVVPAAEPTTAATSAAASETPERNEGAIVPGKSMAGVALGSSLADVERLQGKPEEISRYDRDTTVYYSYQSRGLSFSFSHGILTTIFGYSGRKGGYETGEFQRYGGQTADGIGVDSTLADVTRVYGAPSEKGNLDLAPIPSHWVVYEDQGIGFDFIIETGEIISINVSRRH